MRRDKRADHLQKDDRVYFATKTLIVKGIKPFTEGGIAKVRVSFKGFRDVEFNVNQLITVVD